MSDLHYFQRYNQKENWVTNSVLLLLSRLYQYDRSKFENSMTELFSEEKIGFDIGVKFYQQEKGTGSVVDGVIIQDSLKIVIETKLEDNFSVDQLQKHLETLNGNHSQKILLALSKGKIRPEDKAKVHELLNDTKYKAVKFASTTYEEIYRCISNNLSDFDTQMREILDDYLKLCEEAGLTNIKQTTMLAFTAGASLPENLKYNIYYDPSDRKHRFEFKYIGLYANKAIVAVGELQNIISCDYISGKLVGTEGCDIQVLSQSEYDRIVQTIENTDYYNLRKGSKFFLVDYFHTTDYKKITMGPIRAKKYFWLHDLEGFKMGMSSNELATFLEGKGWN